MKILRLTLYQTVRAIADGNKIYQAKKNGTKRTFWAKSLKHAQEKYRTWNVRKMNLICPVFGHVTGQVDVGNRVSYCKRCGAILRVSYDMSYGETTIEGELDVLNGIPAIAKGFEV